MVARTDRIDLAHVSPFAIGRLRLEPALHQLVRDDGKSEVLQHRVMQVLVALALADGAIVTRDELTMRCWDGRVVGEDAINRILSRLRAVAAGIGEGSFRIETVTRVGYRLLSGGAEVSERQPAAEMGTSTGPNRRLVLAGGGAAALVVVGGAAWWTFPRSHSARAVPPEVGPVMDQALIALGQDTREGQNQGIGLLRHVVELQPDYADGWGLLGAAYAAIAAFRSSSECAAFRQRARSAGRRALALDPDNGFGRVALATAQPAIGHWLAAERALRQAIVEHDHNVWLLYNLAGTLASVGRAADALPLLERFDALSNPTPNVYFVHIRLLWTANRLEEADRMMTEAASVYPTHFAIWFIRFYILLFSGRAGAAIALAEDADQRPSGIPVAEFEAVLRVARAVQNPTAAAVDAVMAEQMGRAREGAGYAENFIQFACALGRIDEAFAVANAYYFGRGFAVPEVRFTREQATYSPPSDRQTNLLFNPATHVMRADPRFGPLVAELGLERYWTDAGVGPDYRRS